MKTQISLFSKDETLVRFFEESIAEGLKGEFTLEVKSSGQVPSGLDLCIWDFIPGETVFPRSISQNQWRKHLFLLHRKNLGVLRALVGVSDIHVLLKPVTEAAVRAFLGGYGLYRLDPHDDQGHRLTTLRSERDEMLQILMQTNLKLQQFKQEKTNFLVRSIHDFRAPLTAISGYCGLLLGEEFEPLTSGQRTLLQRIEHSVRRLSRATDTMFQLSVAESGGAALNVERADIGHSIGRVLEELGPVFENKRISVTVEVEPSPEALLFDTTRIHQVLVNLPESSCKFKRAMGVLQSRATLPFGSVERTARPNPLLLRIAVSGTLRHLIVSASISTIPARRFQPLTRTKFSKSTHHIPAGKTDLGPDWAWRFAA